MKYSLLFMVPGFLLAFSNASMGQAVTWMAKPVNKYYPGEAREFYVYVSLTGNEGIKNEKRVPLNISVVLDRSGSMGGDKIAYARNAANFIVDQLAADDIVSIVNYDDRIEVTSPSEPVRNKEVLKRKISALTARGSTNLTGGMLEGFSQVRTTKKEGYVNRVLLLTDGLANAGITDPNEMKRLVEKKYLEEGVALSTFGLGADYNEDLLTMLAEMGRANYYFIGSPDKIPEIFAKELKGLLSVVAQNAWVKVDFPSNLECTKVYGYPYEVKGSEISIRFNDVYAKDQKGILLKFRARGEIASTLEFNCTMNYVDASNFSPVTSTKRLLVERSSDVAVLKEHQDLLVEEMIALYESTEMFDVVLARVDARDYEAARVEADKAVQYLKAKQVYIQSDKLKKQEDNLSTYSKDIEKVKVMREEERKIYQKSNKSVNYGVKKGKN